MFHILCCLCFIFLYSCNTNTNEKQANEAKKKKKEKRVQETMEEDDSYEKSDYVVYCDMKIAGNNKRLDELGLRNFSLNGTKSKPPIPTGTPLLPEMVHDDCDESNEDEDMNQDGDSLDEDDDDDDKFRYSNNNHSEEMGDDDEDEAIVDDSEEMDDDDIDEEIVEVLGHKWAKKPKSSKNRILYFTVKWSNGEVEQALFSNVYKDAPMMMRTYAKGVRGLAVRIKRELSIDVI